MQTTQQPDQRESEIQKAEQLLKEAQSEIEDLKKENAPKISKAQSKDQSILYYSKIIGGEKNMSNRVSEWPSNEYFAKLSAQELEAYQITSIHWVKGTHFGPNEDYANSLRFSNNLGAESHLYSDKSPDASISTNQRIAKITCRTNYHHVFCFKFWNDFGEVIGKPLYS